MKSRNGQNHSIRNSEALSEPTITVRRHRPIGAFLYRVTFSDLSEQYSGALIHKKEQKSMAVTVANNYWSASTYVPNTTNAWRVNFNNGNVNNNNKTNNNYVRCVAGA